MTFPTGFLWGASTAAHQIEGGNVNSDWWQRDGGTCPGAPVESPSGDAADSYHRYPEDMALLADAGLDTYRFSIEWARIEPEEGWISRAAIDHYRRMVDTARDLGLQPMVTLHHFTNPVWFAREGGWHSDAAADRFARYAEAALPVLDDVDLVCTINEPNMVSVLADPRGRASRRSGCRRRARRHRDAGRRAPAARSRSCAAPASRPAGRSRPRRTSRSPGAEAVAAEYGASREDVFLDAAAGDDWVGVQAYTRTRIGPDGPLPIPDDAERTLTGWEYYPPAVGDGIRNAWERAGVPVYVTENGIATADDTRRIDYTRGALEAVRSCIADGVDVRGYLHWSRSTTTSGAASPDVRAHRRGTARRSSGIPKPSLAWLGEVARANALVRA